MSRKEITDRYVPPSKHRPGRRNELMRSPVLWMVVIPLVVIGGVLIVWDRLPGDWGERPVVNFWASTSTAQTPDGSYLIVFLLFLLWSLLPLIICYRTAGRKGKSQGLWALLALIFGWIAVLVIAASASER